MARTSKMELPLADWPEGDRKRWVDANKSGTDPFDDCGPAAHLAERTRKRCREATVDFWGSFRPNDPTFLACEPEARINRESITEYVFWRRPTCGDAAIAIDLDHLRQALRYICPNTDWSWLLTITKRLAAQAPRKPKRRSSGGKRTALRARDPTDGPSGQ